MPRLARMCRWVTTGKLSNILSEDRRSFQRDVRWLGALGVLPDVALISDTGEYVSLLSFTSNDGWGTAHSSAVIDEPKRDSWE